MVPIEGTSGDDSFDYESSDEDLEIDGGEGNDILVSGAGDDTIDGGAGNDLIVTGAGDDTIDGGAGIDTIIGGAGDDTVYGGADADFIATEAGDDTIYGGADDDFLVAGAGDDTLYGGAGDDRLWGDSGSDTFVFGSGDGNDTIKDFTDGEDAIDLTAITGISGFEDLTITADGSNAVIDLSAHGGGTITLENFDTADLDAGDFIFQDTTVEESSVDGV